MDSEIEKGQREVEKLIELVKLKERADVLRIITKLRYGKVEDERQSGFNEALTAVENFVRTQ